jgi:hypothetical protein
MLQCILFVRAVVCEVVAPLIETWLMQSSVGCLLQIVKLAGL